MNFLKQNKTVNLISNESGQGAIEYILLLTVTVAIIVGLIFQFNERFAEYAENYFGNYLECLLKQGELPSLGAEGGSVTASVCNEEFQAFTAAEGRPPNNANGNNSGNSDPNRTSDGKGNKKSPDKFSSNNSGGGSGGRGERGSGSVSSARDGSGSSFAAKGTNNERRKDKIVVGANGSGPIGKLNNKKDGSPDSASGGAKRIGKFQAFDPSKEKKEKGNIQVKKTKQSDIEGNKKTKSFRQAASIKKNPTIEAEMDLSLGDYLRYLVIAIILIVLLFVVGGQIFQANKGSE